MDIEQIGLAVAGWFAGAFFVALALGKILRDANEPDRRDPEESLVANEAFNTPATRRPQGQPFSKKKRTKSHAASL